MKQEVGIRALARLAHVTSANVRHHPAFDLMVRLSTNQRLCRPGSVEFRALDLRLQLLTEAIIEDLGAADAE